MTPSQFLTARRTLNASVNEMAALLNTDSRTIRRYEDGTRVPSGSTQRLIEALLSGRLDGWKP